MVPSRIGQLLVGPHRHAHAIADLEPRRLAQVVELPSQLARQALAAKLVVERGVERDGVPTVLGEGELGVRRRPHLDLVGTDVDGVAVAELDPVPPVGFERTLDGRTVH